MTRKDYQLIADALNSAHSAGTPAHFLNDYGKGRRYAVENIAHSLADALASDNPRFQRAKFLAACGLSD